MKRFLPLLRIFAAVLLGAALLFACEKPEPEPQPTPGPDPTPPEPAVELTVSVEKLVFSSYGGNQQVTVATNQDSWAAAVSESDAAWLSVSTESSTVTVTVLENTGDKDRDGTITISAGGKKVDLPVKQDAAAGLPAGGENTKVTYTLKEGTVVAPRAFASYIIAHDAEKMTFTLSKDTPRELFPASGTDLIINTPTNVLPGGLLGNIHFVEETADGYLVEYYPLDLTAVFKDLNLDTDELDLNEYVTRVEDAEGNEVPFTKTKAGTQKRFHIDLPQIGWDLPAGFSLTPRMTLDLALKMQMIVGDYKISTLNLNVDMDATIGADLDFMVEVGGEVYFKLFTLYFAAIPLGPVLLTPGVDLYGFVGADGKVGLSASASTVLHTTSKMHYDEINGLSGETHASDPEPGKTKYSAGPKIEAGIHYGLGVGPSIGLFTDVIQAGITINLNRKESLGISIDLISLFSDPDNKQISWELLNADYTIAWEVNSALHLRGFGLAKDFTIPGFGLKEEKYKLFPPVENIQLVQNGGGFMVTADVTGPSLLPGYAGATTGELVLRLEKDGQVLGNRTVSFDLNETMAKALWDNPGSKQVINASIDGLEAGKAYRATLGWKIGDNYLPLYGGFDLIALDNNTLQAIRGILSDIKSCADGIWEGCNWDENDLVIAKPTERNLAENAYKNVTISASETGALDLDIVLPEEWKLGSNLIVSNHSAGLNSIFSWNLSLDSSKSQPIWRFDTISIEDVSFNGMLWPKGSTPNVDALETKVFICHSPRFKWTLPKTTEKIDLSGSGIDSYSYSEPKEILLDDCSSLSEIIIGNYEESAKVFSAKNCPLLKSLHLTGEISVSSAQVQDMINTVSSAGGSLELMLYLDSSTPLDALTFGKGVSEFEGKNVGSVTISNADDLRSVRIRGGTSQLSISGCPRLEEMWASAAGLESFSISGTPVISTLTVDDNPKLTTVVPSVFDQIRKAGGKLKYDVRYEYQHFYYAGGSTYVDAHGTIWHSENKVDWYHDRGYGFYYSDEPGRGYHLKD